MKYTQVKGCLVTGVTCVFCFFIIEFIYFVLLMPLTKLYYILNCTLIIYVLKLIYFKR